MGKIIVQIPLGDGTAIYLTGYDEKTNMVKYRDTTEPKMLLEDPLVIKGDNVILGSLILPIVFFEKLINQ